MSGMYVKKFSECPTYTQESGPNVEYRNLLARGVIADLGMGLVTMQGPTRTHTDTHTGWQQVYLILSGSGTLHVGAESVHVDGPTIVGIPLHTPHSVELAEGETMQYIYVNQFFSQTDPA